ncbi:hypothetical protein Tco_0158737 [Tanacetum coccineum]
MPQLNRLAISKNSLLVKYTMVKLFEINNERDFRIARETYAMCQELNVRCQERQEKMMEMQSFLHVSTILAESYNLLKELHDYEIEKCKELMKSISKIQLKVRMLDLHYCTFSYIPERLSVILEGAKVFAKKGIHPSDYSINFKLADNVPKQGGIFGDCGVWVCVFLYRLAHGLSLDVEDPVNVALAYPEKMTNENPENYVVFEVHNDGVFMEYPLRCSLEEGLTIVEGDGDMNKMYDMGEKYGLIDLYICHIPKNLAFYYYKNLTFDAADEDVLCKVKTHEKRMLDAGSMSPKKLVLGQKKKLNMFGEFLLCDSVADEVVMHDNWEYKGLSLDGYIDVGGSSSCCDLVHESVVCGGPSLPRIEKECFENYVVLDVGATKLLLLLKKARSRVNVTRRKTSKYRTQIKRLRKGSGKRVSSGGNHGRFGSLIRLNDHEGDDDVKAID